MVSWNCQGLGNPKTVRRLKEITKTYRPDICFLIETKNPDDFVLQKCDQLGYDEHFLVTPTGHRAGGLALLWKQEIKLQVLYHNADVIDTSIEYEGKLFYASFVYGSTDRGQRNLLWNHLLASAESRDAPWFLTVDFNDLLRSEEKVGGPEGQRAPFQTCEPSFLKATCMISTIQVTHCLGEAKGVLIWCDVYWIELWPTALGRRITHRLAATTWSMKARITSHSSLALTQLL